MQKILLFIFIICGTSAFSQEITGIYKIRWHIDHRLINQVVINNGMGNEINIPQHLHDSVISVVQRIVTQELQSKTHLLYPLNKKGNELKTNNTSVQVGGLPRGTKRQAMKTEYLEYYVKFKIRVDVNKIVTLGNEMANYSRLKPYVKINMKAYGVDRRVKRRKRIRLGGFEGIGSVEFNLGGTTVTNTNAIPIEKVLDMVFKGLEKFENKIR